MTHTEIRQKFIKFFETKGHTVVPSSSLLPSDSSVLLTTAGMQQFKRYFTGELDPIKDFGSKNTTSIQKAFRTSDIDEVGDETHLTFFQMLGHFSFGDYFKKETINWTYELLTEVFKIPIERISATVFEGDDSIPFDKESFEAWSKLLPPAQIRKGPRADNVWGPAGTEGPCGVCNEVYVDDVEVATLVFMEYYCNTDKKLTELSQRGVDVGWGFERIVSKIQQKNNFFETDLFEPLISLLPDSLDVRKKRIIADHLRAAVFLIADGVVPSNKEQGYILRRLLRRAMVYENQANLSPQVFEDVLIKVIDMYSGEYPELKSKRDVIINTYFAESSKFKKAVAGGLKELEKLETINAQSAFKLYESFGLPYEVIKEVGANKTSGLNREDFETERVRHQEISRAGVEKKFGGHGIKEGDLTAENLPAGRQVPEDMKKVIRLHTATHLIVAALQEVLGQKLPQAGADITAERLRFDFTFPRKITDEELRKAETIANKIVDEDLPVVCETMPLDDALKSGASAFFKLKYPPQVKVYSIGKNDSWFSRELCGGPHVSHTGEVGHITITKEESVSGGNRRIRATIE